MKSEYQVYGTSDMEIDERNLLVPLLHKTPQTVYIEIGRPLRFLLVAGMIVITLLLSGCDSPTPSQPTTSWFAGSNGTSTPSSSNNGVSGTSMPSSSNNVVSGTVVDTQGKPISGANIIINGLTSASGTQARYTTTTDANGVYSQQVSQGVYNVYAFDPVSYENVQWSLYLNPTDNSNEAQDSSKGITKNFQWKLQGQMPGTTGTNYDNFYGACVVVNLGVLSSVPSGATFTFTLIPNGSLIDGSTGQAVTFQRTQQDLHTDLGSVSVNHTDYLCDIPIGDYRISGQVAGSDGTTQPILFGGQQSEEISWAGVSQPAEHVVNQIPVNISVGGQ